jgi:DnaK suppressor protein
MPKKTVKPLKAEKLKKKELDAFKVKLLALREELYKELKINEEAGLEAGSGEEVKDLADQASDNFDRELAYNISETERHRLEDIDRALERILDGSYGICRISKKPIPKPRLEALPFVTVTVDVQAQLESGEIEDPERR